MSSSLSEFRRFRSRRTGGFALVIVLSLMILLTLLAVGLLTLSAVALRGSTQGNAMAMARGNARLGMLLALGELQKHAGPDRIITAPSSILSERAVKPQLTGVWESWDYLPNAADLDYAGEKQNRFRRWLVSNSSPEETAVREFPTTRFSGETILLAGAKAFGADAAGQTDERQFITAGRVPVQRAGRALGALAWHVADESAKARINSYRNPAQEQGGWQKRALLAGHRPDPSLVKDSAGGTLSFLPTDADTKTFEIARETEGKLVSLNQADLLADSRRIARFRSHVTPYSLGVPVNVRTGGLKEDLSTLFAYSPAALPAVFNGKKLYATTHQITGASDPYWSTLKGYYDVYRERSLENTIPVYYTAARYFL